MENLTYNNIGSVLQLNKAGELVTKRMKAAKVCEGLYLSAPDRTNFVGWIIEYNGVKWIERTAPAAHSNPETLTKRMPKILANIAGGELNRLNDYHKELHRRIFNPEQPAIMELKQTERKKTEPLAEGQRKVSVMMFKGYTDEITDKKVIITEVAPHVYTYVYKLARYGERVKIIFEIDGVYFQGSDNGAYIMERDNFTEVCKNAYEHARQNIAEGAAKGTPYFVELAKRIEAIQPEQQNEELTEQEREFIATIEAHRNAEGKIIAWEIMDNGNGKVIFENSDKNRYVCAYVVKMNDGSYFLHFVGERPGRPYERTIYKRKTNALKGFEMAEGCNIRQQPATPTAAPEISTESTETGKVSAEDKTEQQDETTAPEAAANCSKLPQPPKFAPQSTQTERAVKCTIPASKRAQRANTRPKLVVRKAWTYATNSPMSRKWSAPIILPRSAKCYPANPPPILVAPTEFSPLVATTEFI